jgi:hypothetical protein
MPARLFLVAVSTVSVRHPVRAWYAAGRTWRAAPRVGRSYYAMADQLGCTVLRRAPCFAMIAWRRTRRWLVIAEMIRALIAAAAVAVLPGYFWAAVLRPASGLADRLAYSAVLSMASVPVIAITIARIAGTGITLWVALASVALVLASGILIFVVKGPAPGAASAALPRADLTGNPATLALIAVVLVLVLAVGLSSRAPGWLLLVTVAGIVLAGALAAWPTPVPPRGQAIESDPMTIPTSVRRTASMGPAGAGLPATGGPAPAAEPTLTRSPAPSTMPTAAGKQAAPDGIAGTSDRPNPVRTLLALESARGQRPWLRDGALAAVLLLAAVRVYDGVIRFDWPYLRGGDQFNHAVMAEQMLSHGSYGTYLVYPPGFSALTAVICRVASLPPLALFPVLAPALLILPALAAYALATKLWGWRYGIAAAALNGLMLTGAYASFADGRYPDLVAAYFLLPMTIAALISLYTSPSLRSGVLVTVVGSSVVLYHSVATLYLAVLLAAVGITGLPYLLFTGCRRQARTLLLALAAVAVVSAGYAAYIYDLPKAVTGQASSTTAVSIVLGTQPPLPVRHVFLELAPVIVCLGMFGVVLLIVGLRHLTQPPQMLAAGTVLLWCLLMYAGSRTALDGFPQRFERDLGAPLSVTGALALGLIARTLWTRRAGTRPLMAVTATAAAALTAVMAAVQMADDLRHEVQPAHQVLTRPVALAGQWLARHNTGGNIISTYYMNPGISSRAVLAMGGYTGLQSFSPRRIAHPRSLPTAGRQPLLDSREVLLHPATCQAASIIDRDDVRYVVIYKFGSGADLTAFGATPARYHPVFENGSVIIYRTAHTACKTPS